VLPPATTDAAVALAAPISARQHPEETAPREIDNYSRELRAVAGQFVEIPYRGKGWIFLGEMNSSRGISYDSRRLDEEGQTFVFRALNPGEYFLKFNKQDFVNNYYVNDIVKVMVGENTAHIPTGHLSSTRVVAPRWEAPPAPNTASDATLTAGTGAPAGTETVAVTSAASQTVAGAVTGADAAVQAETAATQTGAGTAIDTASSAGVIGTLAQTPSDGGASLMSKARTDFDAKNYAAAIASLDQLSYGAVLDDEALWLYGQSFEANSPARNIKAALGSYQSLIRGFPQSKYYGDAQSRVAYLNKFYFDIK
jgi:hypothetical protein